MKRKKDREEQRRCEEIIATAHELSKALIKLEPADHTTAIANYEMIYEICANLVRLDRPARRPEYDVVAMYVAKMRPDPIVARTIKNRYRRMTAIWCKAYDKIVGGRTMHDWTDFSRVPISGRDSELSVDIHKEVVRRLWVENTRLRALLKDSGKETDFTETSAPERPLALDAAARTEIDFETIREWVGSVGGEQSFLSETEVGLKLTDKARFGMIVMDSDTFETLKALAANATG